MGKRIVRKLGLIITVIFTCTGFFILYEILAPELAYQIDKPDEEQMIEYIESSVELTKNRLIIPSIGVDMEIGEHECYLDFGGWVQETNNDKIPSLIAVHRFGWNTLSPEEKVKLTLYHVNKLEQGDVIYLMWDNELYTYYVQDVIEGVNNPQSESNLVIYTCKFMSARQRIFIVVSLA